MRPARLLTTALLVLCSAQSVSQSPPRTSPLQTALQTRWDAQRRGSLIAIDPGSVQPYAFELMRRNAVSGSVRSPDPLPADASLLTTLEYYGRKLMSAGSLTVIAPTEMKVLNTRLGPPDIYAGLPRESKLRLLQASLSEAQWRMLGSPDGLGVGDLKREQQPLFLSILPDPFTVVKGRVDNRQFQQRPDNQPLTLTPDVRARTRLRMNRSLGFSFPAETEDKNWIAFNRGRLRTEGQEVLLLIGGDRDLFRRSPYGAELAHYLPNRLKTGDIAFDSAKLDVTVSLLPDQRRTPAGGERRSAAAQAPPLTVGDLVARVAKSAGMELYADPRPAGLSVWTAGRSARAGDLLRALCLGVTGVFRKVGPAYVLTDDLKGIGARRCLIAEWCEDAKLKETALLADVEETISKQQPDRFVGFIPGDALPLDPDRLSGIAPNWDRRMPMDSLEVALHELPRQWQARLRDEVVRGNAQHSGPEYAQARLDRVRISVPVTLNYLIPGVGVVEDGARSGSSWSRGSGDTPFRDRPRDEGLKAPPAFPDLPFRALQVTLATPADAAPLAAEAKRSGFTHLWVDAPETGSLDLIKAASDACTMQGLTLMPVVRLLFKRLPKDEKKPEVPSKEADLNVLEETASAYQERRGGGSIAKAPADIRDRLEPRGDWLRIDTPETQVSASSRAAEIAAIPGIAGLVLRDIAPPGFTDPGKLPYGYTSAGWDFGYTLPLRLEMLRKEGLDPIDLPIIWHGVFENLTDLPFFSDDRIRQQFIPAGDHAIPAPGKTVSQNWNALRFERHTAWMVSLFKKLRATAPSLPIMVEGLSSIGPRSGRYAWWHKADGVPDFSPLDGHPLGAGRDLPAIASISHRGWSQVPAPGQHSGKAPLGPLRKDDPQDFAVDASVMLSRPDKALQGYAIDLSDLPAERAIDFIRALPPVR